MSEQTNAVQCLAPMPPGISFGADESYFSFDIIGMNPQSRGEITLKSNNSDDMPLLDFRYLSNQYDQQILVQGIREDLRFLQTPMLAKHFKKFTFAPKSSSEDDIW
jgi:choline dehydrogenase